MVIERVPQKHFSGQRALVESTLTRPRSLLSILNELIDGVNAGSVIGVDHFVVQFDHTAWVAGWLSLGVCPGGRVAQGCVVEVVTPFDGGALCTVGDVVAQGRLMSASGSALWSSGLYRKLPHHLYATDQGLYVYFSAGAPSTGTGQVIVYLS